MKSKIAEFSEDERYSQAQKWTVRGGGTEVAAARGGAGFGPRELLLLEVEARVTPNRAANAESKIGRVAIDLGSVC